MTAAAVDGDATIKSHEVQLPLLSSQGLQNFGLSSILATYMRGLESEGVEWGAELRELRFQAAWRNMQWDCELPER